jgi:hypothetical protein
MTYPSEGHGAHGHCMGWAAQGSDVLLVVAHLTLAARMVTTHGATSNFIISSPFHNIILSLPQYLTLAKSHPRNLSQRRLR